MLLDAKRSQLLIVDIQDRLQPHIHDGDSVVQNTGILLEAARVLDIPVTVSEQYRKGLGLSISAIRDRLDESEILEKVHFSCAADDAIMRRLRHVEKSMGRDQVVICGTEAHICVLQSALGLMESGQRVAVVMDAVGSRHARARDLALARMLRHGLETVNTEMALFEWLHRAATDDFRRLSKLVK